MLQSTSGCDFRFVLVSLPSIKRTHRIWAVLRLAITNTKSSTAQLKSNDLVVNNKVIPKNF